MLVEHNTPLLAMVMNVQHLWQTVGHWSDQTQLTTILKRKYKASFQQYYCNTNCILLSNCLRVYGVKKISFLFTNTKLVEKPIRGS